MLDEKDESIHFAKSYRFLFSFSCPERFKKQEWKQRKLRAEIMLQKDDKRVFRAVFLLMMINCPFLEAWIIVAFYASLSYRV